MNESVTARSHHAATVQNLKEQLNQQAEIAREWETRHNEQSVEKEVWIERFRGLILWANSTIPEFAYAFK